MRALAGSRHIWGWFGPCFSPKTPICRGFHRGGGNFKDWTLSGALGHIPAAFEHILPIETALDDIPALALSATGRCAFGPDNRLDCSTVKTATVSGVSIPAAWLRHVGRQTRRSNPLRAGLPSSSVRVMNL